jgi:hypothetical protein
MLLAGMLLGIYDPSLPGWETLVRSAVVAAVGAIPLGALAYASHKGHIPALSLTPPN